MDKKKFFKVRLYFTGTLAMAVWLLLAWDYFHGGVPTHHILQRNDLPGFSNRWGGLLIPLLTWFLLYRVQRRISKNPPNSTFPVNLLYAFIAALCMGILLSVFFTLGYTELPLYLLIGLLLLALFLPIYRAECFLGFMTGMIFTFGGVLPVPIVSILCLIAATLYLLLRPGILFIFSGLSNLVSPNRQAKGS